MSHRVALTRAVSPAIDRCELTHLARTPIDLARARRQHAVYEQRLAELGCEVVRVPSDDDMADGVFIEDTAIALDEVAIVARPGAASRRRETDAVAAALARYRPLQRLTAPATLDGGDVLAVGRHLFVGVSSRTNQPAVDQLRAIAAPYGYAVVSIAVDGCLHLKSAVTALADATLLVNRAWVDARAFDRFDLVDVDPAEPWSANAVRVGAAIVFPAEFPRTRDRIAARGFAVHTVEADELARAEGAVTCCSIILGVSW